MCTATRKASGHAFDGGVIHDILTGLIRAERLGKKHRQRLGWGNNRSRCGGISDSTSLTNSGRVNRLKVDASLLWA